MPDVVSVDLVTDESRPILVRLWQLYMHDLSEFRGTMPDAEGQYATERLATFFDDPDRACYLIRHGSNIAGLALIRGVSSEPRVMGEFFIVRGARRHGVGYQAAVALLSAHPGRWEIAFQEQNTTAARFWRQVATDVVGTTCVEERRPIPGKPDLRPDTWLVLTTPAPPGHP